MMTLKEKIEAVLEQAAPKNVNRSSFLSSLFNRFKWYLSECWFENCLEHLSVLLKFCLQFYQEWRELAYRHILALLHYLRNLHRPRVIKTKILDLPICLTSSQPLNQELILEVAIEGPRSPIASRYGFMTSIQLHNVEPHERLLQLTMEIIVAELWWNEVGNGINGRYPRVFYCNSPARQT